MLLMGPLSGLCQNYKMTATIGTEIYFDRRRDIASRRADIDNSTSTSRRTRDFRNPSEGLCSPSKLRAKETFRTVPDLDTRVPDLLSTTISKANFCVLFYFPLLPWTRFLLRSFWSFSFLHFFPFLWLRSAKTLRILGCLSRFLQLSPLCELFGLDSGNLFFRRVMLIM